MIIIIIIITVNSGMSNDEKLILFFVFTSLVVLFKYEYLSLLKIMCPLLHKSDCL